MKIPIIPQGYGDQLYKANLLTEHNGLTDIGGGGPVAASRSGGSSNWKAFSTSWLQLHGVNDCNIWLAVVNSKEDQGGQR